MFYLQEQERVEVITSMNPNDIKFDEGSSMGGAKYGQKVLSDYLNYAHTGKLYSGEVTDREVGIMIFSYLLEIS